MKKQVNTLWGAAFAEQPGASLIRFTSGRDVAPVPPADQALVPYDLWVNTAHTVMLAKTGIISPADATMLLRGLATLEEEVNAGKFTLDPQAEDVHTAIELWLTRQVGPEVAGKIHTARSRNDQVVTDMRLFLRDQVINLVCNGLMLLETLIELSDTHKSVPIPGFTHHQHAMVTTLGHVFAAMASMISRDLKRLETWYELHNVSPLGNAASFGTSFAIDRTMTAKLLGFDGPDNNSLDAITNRWEPEGDLIYAQSVLMNHCSVLAETLILFSMPEFGFITLADSFCTGSSMMPQKKNPDVAELIRGKTGRVYGNLVGLLTVLKALPLAYNKDMQEDKEGMLDTVYTLQGALQLFAPMVATMKVNRERMRQAVNQDFSNATDIADYLVTKGLPFRQAHEIIGKIVLYCIQNKRYLLDLSLEEYHQFSSLFDQNIFEVLQPEHVVNARNVYGGTASNQVAEAIVRAEDVKKEAALWYDSYTAKNK